MTWCIGISSLTSLIVDVILSTTTMPFCAILVRRMLESSMSVRLYHSFQSISKTSFMYLFSLCAIDLESDWLYGIYVNGRQWPCEGTYQYICFLFLLINLFSNLYWEWSLLEVTYIVLLLVTCALITQTASTFWLITQINQEVLQVGALRLCPPLILHWRKYWIQADMHCFFFLFVSFIYTNLGFLQLCQ